jgi:tRNA (guanine-N7-)-methyltransferase
MQIDFSTNSFEMKRYLEQLSFVKRQSRMTEFQSQALQTGAAWLLTKEDLSDIHQAYPDPSLPLCIEIGFGMGENILWLAEHSVQMNILGVDVYRPGIGALVGRLAAKNLQHVRVIEGDAKQVLSWLPRSSCQQIHLFFLDPWPKKRHHKRRLIQAELMVLVRHVLAEGGWLHVATDHADYAAHIEACLQSDGFALSLVADHSQVRCLTKYEARGLRLGHQIFEFSAQCLYAVSTASVGDAK